MLIVIVVIDALAQRRSIEMTRRKRLLSRTADQERRREGMKDMLKKGF